MSVVTRLFSSSKRVIAAALSIAIVAVVVFAGYSYLHRSKTYHLTAYFPQTIGIYQGSSVRILGVPVGTVTKVRPQGTQVRVDLTYDADHPLPTDVGAAIVPPSIVSDRYLQLAPAYTSGPKLGDNAVLQEDKTEVPVELDQIFGSLNDLSTALGPNGANSKGALSQLINVGAENLNGNGTKLNSTLKGFSMAIETLSDNRNVLFGTVDQLQRFTSNLAADDGGVRTLNAQLATVSGQLAGERQDLGAALANLSHALGTVQAFIATNRSPLTHDITALTKVGNGLVSEKQAITEILDDAPLALHNLGLSFDNTADGGLGVLRTRTTVDFSTLLCTLLAGTVQGITQNLNSVPGAGTLLNTVTSEVAACGSGTGLPSTSSGTGGTSGLSGLSGLLPQAQRGSTGSGTASTPSTSASSPSGTASGLLNMLIGGSGPTPTPSAAPSAGSSSSGSSGSLLNGLENP